MADQVMPALVKRRAELMAELEKAQGHVQQLHADLASLDAVIRQFDPDYPVGNIRPRYRRAASAAEFGSMSRTVLDILRRDGGALSTRDIADQIIAERALNAGDKGLRSNMVKRVNMALRYQRTNGMVREVAMAGAEAAWEIAT
ncbi:hypothetical protein [Roseicella sp. DB1501]|uniref:hypothetical protein n=1 Tax=Roseicella sp. DB1501 TaxID=2730925 RepID=UPI0014925846|nr:hypothetical protein [Roseicella sp. DB1501]NOG73036.1 hypothetical protein [Roseicella sp. DB1501]